MGIVVALISVAFAWRRRAGRRALDQRLELA
jgi:hypothetical protein